ncbi:VOC family protein [Methylosinus sp. Sm6]|uniref:VOC family protein n=1 Tax=Methylosinus sp. Sm6 TaxID=2866948 RepID=UPI001C99B48E|nr:VOC family protein [Methylosinus sp. Sm6]MBY6241941.1 VOC family protein [Methylosinus sp. Sm6]
MTIVLNHTIVPAHDKAAAARWFAGVFDLPLEQPDDHFVPVYVNDALTFLFADADSIAAAHYAFHVSEPEFDAILSRVRASGRPFGSAPWSRADGKLNDWNGGKGVYFETPDGHLMELMTVPQ